MDAGMRVSIVAAASLNSVIGKDGDLPWHISNDLRRFAEMTRGHTVIVGRITHEAILKRNGGPLKDRTTIVVTRNQSYQARGCFVINSLKEAFRLAKSTSETEAFVIGGAEIYKEALPYADRIHLTVVSTFCEGDAFFPPIPDEEWTRVSADPHDSNDENPLGYTFVVYERQARVKPATAPAPSIQGSP